MGFLKVGNGWTAVGAVVGGAHDHEASPSGANQEEEPTVGPIDEGLTHGGTCLRSLSMFRKEVH